ncbi:DNA adenine methylase [Candidatus Micrarchaeota archaeon]|nr:DNA adenine methylase [Candidatus Micrarchaeota archaeon]MBU1681245.1 DNA adenine methylase [Candidatus Micrarchaeota archaeon]
MRSPVSKFDHVQVVKYAGNKAKLLGHLIPIITKILAPNQTLLDLFAGTHAVGYALKTRNRIIGNDVQAYGWAIGKGILESNYSLSTESAKDEILSMFDDFDYEKYHLFSEIYSNTYFGKKQCLEVDKLKFAIDNSNIPTKKKFSYLCCLMYSMGQNASTTGYFAQYLPREKTKQQKSRSIIDHFLKKCNSFNLVKGSSRNISLKYDYKKLFSDKRLTHYIEDSAVIYADPPYSQAHYSRYYHILETLVEYDYPKTSYKGLYRPGRFLSDFCRKSTVEKEFQRMFSSIATHDKKLVLSYVNSGSGLLPEKKLLEIASTEFSNVSEPIRFNYHHSRLGNGKPLKVEEYVLVCH